MYQKSFVVRTGPKPRLRVLTTLSRPSIYSWIGGKDIKACLVLTVGLYLHYNFLLCGQSVSCLAFSCPAFSAPQTLFCYDLAYNGFSAENAQNPQLWHSVMTSAVAMSRLAVYSPGEKDISELWEHIVAAWDELDQRIIDTAVGQWCTRLCACVKALDGHFEHKLWLVVSH